MVRRSVLWMAAMLFLYAAGAQASAQTVLGEGPRNQRTPVKDSSMLKPPAGAKVAIVEWTDMECPYCAYAFPIVRATATRLKVPIVHYDFMIPGHQWSPQAEVFARYLKDRVSPALELEYRSEVFAKQRAIASREDLDLLTKQFMAAHGKAMPFVVDPGDRLKREVQADHDLGLKMGLIHTPTLFVVTRDRWIDVANINELDHAIGMAQAEAGRPVQRKVGAK